MMLAILRDLLLCASDLLDADLPHLPLQIHLQRGVQQRQLLRVLLLKAHSSKRSRAFVLRMKRAWSDGTTSIVFDALELIGKLVAPIPPRHCNLTSYAGVFASRSADQLFLG